MRKAFLQFMIGFSSLREHPPFENPTTGTSHRMARSIVVSQEAGEGSRIPLWIPWVLSLRDFLFRHALPATCLHQNQSSSMYQWHTLVGLHYGCADE